MAYDCNNHDITNPQSQPLPVPRPTPAPTHHLWRPEGIGIQHALRGVFEDLTGMFHGLYGSLKGNLGGCYRQFRHNDWDLKRILCEL